MSGALNLRQFLMVALAWSLIALVVLVGAMSVSGTSTRLGVDVRPPWHVVSVELRGRGWIGPALDADEALEFDELGQRQPRVLASGLVGMALAAAGVTLQALLRNALADPYILGISGGSMVGVALWKLLPAASLAMLAGRSVPAVGGAFAACLLVFLLAHRRQGLEPMTLLLVGVVVSSICGAALMILSMLETPDTRASLALYVIGGISENDLSRVLMGAALIGFVIGYVPVLLSAAALNIGTLADTQAASLGLNIQRLRMVCFACASVMTGSAMLLAGPIGFVGLICPHICRRIPWLGGGADHRTLLVSAPLCGAAFLMAADTLADLAQTFQHGALPVGVVTALCGGPFFLYLLRRRAA